MEKKLDFVDETPREVATCPFPMLLLLGRATPDTETLETKSCRV